MFIQDMEPKDANGIQKHRKEHGETDGNLSGNENRSGTIHQPRNADADHRSKERFEKDAEIIQRDFCNTKQRIQRHDGCNQVTEQRAGSRSENVDFRNAYKGIIGDDLDDEAHNNQLDGFFISE